MRWILAALLSFAAPSAAHAIPPTPTDAYFDAIAADTRATMLGDPAAAVIKAERARSYAQARPPGARRDLMVATAAWLMGEAYTRTGQNDRARSLIESAARQAMAVAPGSRLLADALLSRGSLRAADGDVARAMSDLHAAHDLFRRLGESRGRARAFAQIANLYYDANDWNNALKYFSQSLEVYDADPGLAVSIYNGRGLALLELKRTADALPAFAQAVAIARDLKSPLLTATILKNVARARLAANQVDAAETAIRESLSLSRGLAPADFIRRQLALLAQVAYQKHQLARAERLIDEAYRGIDPANTTLADREAHQTAYVIYHALGRNDVALVHLTALKRLDDEATDLVRSNGTALMAARFDFANQELRIAKLKADDLRKSIDFERSRARTQRMILMDGVAATLVVIAVLVFALITVRRSRDRVRAANVDLESTNTALGKALAAKTEFLATTSHEIRTPLNGILGMTQVMLADLRVDPATRERVQVVHAAGVTMRALVDDILDVAKMETGALTIEERPFDLRETLNATTPMWEEQAHAKGLTFAVDLRDCPSDIVGDPGRLRQIAFNLLSNALKFTPSGSVAIEARRCGERYEIVVRDTGIGVAPERHEEIFESFRQADATMTRRFGGTGLGLTICRNLARAMGGDVTIESMEGEGATFTLSLPLIEGAVAPLTVSARAMRLGTIVIDRNPITRAKIKSVIEADANLVEAVADLAAAEALLASHSCRSVVVDDEVLGDADVVAAALGKLVRAAAGARTIVLRRADGPDRDVLLAAGATLVLQRPIPREVLIAAARDEPSDGEAPAVVTLAA